MAEENSKEAEQPPAAKEPSHRRSSPNASHTVEGRPLEVSVDERGLERGLEDDRVARHERRQRATRGYREREVPRRRDHCHALGLDAK